ncbi:MAG: tetratricopeptide repeat protein [Ignavibacteria bacterium]|nr:tetratricopeptide repeat protein [Ignavibacteria bacterium]
MMLFGCSKEPKLTTMSADALQHYQEGVALWEQFYYSEGKESFERSLSNDSAFAMAWARLGMLNLRTHNEPEARADIAKALRYSSRSTRLEQLYISLWNRQIHYVNDEAAEIADSIIMLYPEEKEAYIIRGRFYELDKKLDSAIMLYQKAIEIDIGYAHAVMLLGYAYSNAGEQSKAISQMERYIRLSPNVADPRASYADLLFRVGRYDEALVQYKKSLQLKPDYWYSITQIGQVYMVLGMLDDAEKQFRRGISLLPQNVQLEASLIAAEARLNVYRGEYDRAVQQFQEALAVDSTSFGAAYGIVYALSRLKRFREADEMIPLVRAELERRDLAESHWMLGFHLMKARVLREQDRLTEARAACEDAIMFSTALTRGSVYRELAEIYLKDRSYDNAFEACEQALRINPNSPEVLLTLTKVYHATSDNRMTQEIGNRLLTLWKNADPDFQYMHELQGLLGAKQSSGLTR